MNFVESKYTVKNTDTLVIPVLVSNKRHWVNNEVSFFYIYDLINKSEEIVSSGHNDVLPICLDNFDFTTANQFIYNKKVLGQKTPGYDSRILIWLDCFETVNLKVPRHYIPPVNNINNIIPITNWIESCREYRDKFIQSYINYKDYFTLEKYTNLSYDLSLIEQNGLYTKNGYEYSEYNLLTTTGRPSNSFMNVNYAALNKDNGDRKRFISRHGNDGILIEFDLRAFHPFLLGKLIQYEFPDQDIYEHLSKFYPEGIDAKTETFRQIYGGINPDYKKFDFFKKVDEFSEFIFSQKEYKSILFGKRFDSENLTKVKLLNYIMQSFETEFNAQLLSEINEYLYNRSTKIILYTYDSFLFDFNINDGKSCLDGLKCIFDNIPYRIKRGKNYHDMLNES